MKSLRLLSTVLFAVTLLSGQPYFVAVSDASASEANQPPAPTFTKITTGPVVEDIGGWSVPTWWDYDHDGWLDLYVAQASSSGNVKDALYHSNKDGTFSRATNTISTRVSTSWNAAAGDFNNDGFDDLVVAHIFGADDLYRNDGQGNFRRLTKSDAGLPVADMDNSVDSGWADYNRDGFIDLFAANAYNARANDCLYQNNGNGTFTKMTASQVGALVSDNAATGPCAWVDYDNDLWPDLWVGTAWGDNGASGKQSLFHNNCDGTFSKVSAGSLDRNAAGGVALWADYDNDGFLDVFLTSWTRTNSLHRNLGGQTFADVSEAAGLARAKGDLMGAWGDFDNDGFLDLIVLPHTGATPAALYRNNTAGTFTSVNIGSPLEEGDRRVGVAWADYDNDGFLDLLITCGDARPMNNLLYHNDGNSHRWLKVKLTGTKSNRSAIGAKVRVQATIRGQQMWQMREITGNSGNTSGAVGATGLIAHFGLGDATNVTALRIEWPSGTAQQLSNVGANQFLTIWEPPVIRATTQNDGTCRLLITAEPNRPWQIQASSDLNTWRGIASITNNVPTIGYADETAAGMPCRFYRVVAE